MRIVKESVAGTLESSDVLVRVIPADKNKIIINSSVKKLFGEEIMNMVKNTLETFEVVNANVIIEDKGALNFILRARLITALYRASNEKSQWNKILEI